MLKFLEFCDCLQWLHFAHLRDVEIMMAYVHRATSGCSFRILIHEGKFKDGLLFADASTETTRYTVYVEL